MNTEYFDILDENGAKDCFIPGIGHMGKKIGLEELPEVIEIVHGI